MFAILKKLADNDQAIYGDGTHRDPARRLRLPALARGQLPARRRRHLRQPRPRCGASACAPATRSKARSARPRTASATSPCCKVNTINFERPEALRHRINFDNLTPLYPDEKLKMEMDGGGRHGADHLRGAERAARHRFGPRQHRPPHHRHAHQEGVDLDAAAAARHLDPRHRPDRADRQGPARPDRRAAAHRQDGDAAEHRARHHRQPSRGLPDGAADRRAAGGSHRHGAHREGRGRHLDLRRAGDAPRRR